MKKFLAVLFAMMMLITSSACGDGQSPHNSGNSSNPFQTDGGTKNDDPQETISSILNVPEKDSFDAVDAIVQKDIEDTIEVLRTQYEELTANIDAYDKYSSNITQVEEFYEKILHETHQLCIRMREYSINYAELVLDSGKSTDDMYDDIEIIYDSIYDDAGDEIYDEIYDDILDDMYNAFYDGILDDAYDNVPYREWSDARSDEYKWWSDTRSDVYEEWSDCRSDIYEFWSDIRSELWDDDIDKAKEIILDFQRDIEKLKNKHTSNTQENSKNNNADPSNPIDSNSSNSPINGVRPEFKAALDSYEEFFDEYIDFMETYSNSDNTLAMLADYVDYMTKYTEMMESMNALDDSEMSAEEAAYYLEVTTRINQKLLTAAY